MSALALRMGFKQRYLHNAEEQKRRKKKGKKERERMREWGMEGGRKERSKEKGGRKRRKEKRKVRGRKGKERGEGKAGKRGGKGEEGIWAEHNGMTAPYNPPCTIQTTSWRELEEVCALGRSFGSSSVRRSNARPGAAAASQVPPVTSQPSLLHHVL